MPAPRGGGRACEARRAGADDRDPQGRAADGRVVELRLVAGARVDEARGAPLGEGVVEARLVARRLGLGLGLGLGLRLGLLTLTLTLALTWLHAMHVLISSSRPSRAFCTRKGSARKGRAIETMSAWPCSSTWLGLG